MPVSGVEPAFVASTQTGGEGTQTGVWQFYRSANWSALGSDGALVWLDVSRTNDAHIVDIRRDPSSCELAATANPELGSAANSDIAYCDERFAGAIQHHAIARPQQRSL